MDILFISDLHLSEERPHTTAAFLAFLESTGRQAGQLFILGDLFDAWVGDDDDRPLVVSVASALAKLSADGTDVYFQHGNRDFLLGQAYADRCGMVLLPALYVLSLGGTACLLAHGDQFCTDDAAYQQFRQMVRNPEWQTQFLRRDLQERRQIAADLRSRSREANSMKPQDIMDVAPQAVNEALQQAGVQGVLHGHTHRPACHHVGHLGVQGERYVLGDWDRGGWIARWRAGKGLALEQWPSPAE